MERLCETTRGALLQMGLRSQTPRGSAISRLNRFCHFLVTSFRSKLSHQRKPMHVDQLASTSFQC